MKRHYLKNENNYATQPKQQCLLKHYFCCELEIYSRRLVKPVKAKLMSLRVTALWITNEAFDYSNLEFVNELLGVLSRVWLLPSGINHKTEQLGPMKAELLAFCFPSKNNFQFRTESSAALTLKRPKVFQANKFWRILFSEIGRRVVWQTVTDVSEDTVNI